MSCPDDDYAPYLSFDEGMLYADLSRLELQQLLTFAGLTFDRFRRRALDQVLVDYHDEIRHWRRRNDGFAKAVSLKAVLNAATPPANRRRRVKTRVVKSFTVQAA